MDSAFHPYALQMLGKDKSIIRASTCFSPLVGEVQHRQKQQLTHGRKSDYQQAVSDIRQQFFNSVSIKGSGQTQLAGKKAERWTGPSVFTTCCWSSSYGKDS